MLGKEILCVKAKKNKIEHNPVMLARQLQREDLEFRIFEIDCGKTDKGYEFTSLRIYVRKKEKK